MGGAFLFWRCLMRKLIFSSLILGIILSNCTKHIEGFEYDDSDSFLTVVKWKISGNDRTDHYEFKEGAGVSKLSKSWVKANMYTGSKTTNAKMGEIEQGDGFIAFWINGTRYVYLQE
jgi:hypothetical protein